MSGSGRSVKQMSNREKVIEGLKAMRDFLGIGLSSQTQVFEEDQKILEDAIAMLKDQETTATQDQYCRICCLIRIMCLQ